MNQNQDQTPQSKEPPFDQMLSSQFTDLAAEALGQHVELRGVVVLFDFKGGLNRARDVKTGIWVCEDGPAIRPDEIFGGLEVTGFMLNHQVQRAQQLIQQMRDETQVVGQELARRRKQLEDAGRSSGPDQPTGDPP